MVRKPQRVSRVLEESMRRTPALAIAMTTFSLAFLVAIVLGLL
jgi:hypothetical protein